MGKGGAGVDFQGVPFIGSAGLEKRRSIVLDLKLRGMNNDAVAAILKVHRNTISNDLRAIRKAQAEAVRGMDADAEVGGTADYYRKIRDMAYSEYLECKTNSGKLGFLQVALRAQEMHAKLLMDIGVIEKAPMKSSTMHSGSVEMKLGEMPTSDLEAKRDDLLKRLGVGKLTRN